MENGESGDDLSHGYLVEEPTYVVNSDDVIDQGENTDDSSGVQFKSAPLREQDRFLPIANVAKIMKKAIPENGKIAKDARECVQECISEFISFITSEASDRCHLEKRKTINGEDILFAMSVLGFDNYIEPLKFYLQRYREMALQHVGQKIDKPISFDEQYKAEELAHVQEVESDTTPETVIYAYPNGISDFIP